MEDKYLWLENVLGEKSLEWARNENKKTIGMFESEPWFKQDIVNLQTILESKEKIPFVSFIDDGFVYNTWTDEKNIQGIIRRTSLESYKEASPEWEILIDLDKLSLKDAQKWVSRGIELSPNKERALVFLSPGGSDSHIVREYDMLTKSFVKENAFELPLSKGSAAWANDNELFLERDFGLETLTASGYPRTIRKWKRGEILEDSQVIFEIPKEDTFVFINTFHDQGQSLAMARKSKDFYHSENYVYDGNAFSLMDLPQNTSGLGNNLEYAYLSLNENWKEFKAADVIAYHFKTKRSELVFRPDSNSSVYSGGIIKDGLLLIIDTDVKGRLLFFQKTRGQWVSETISLPENGSIDTLATGITTNDFFVTYDSFDTPVSYFYGHKNKIESVVKKQPSYFNFENIEVHQHFTKSPDGTMIPYFLVHSKDMKLDGSNPTILYGYGGFEVSLKAHFNNMLGKAWLDKGGVYVLSNIRGGGEYGPAWHQSALKEKRQRAYDDFYAIAEDLFAKKITSPKHLGAQGGSNGGLLMGVCYTQRPDLFAAINCGVPLLDMRRYHKLLAGYSWIAEYGNPDDEVDGAFIRKLSPYHQINKEQKNYPMMFLNTSTKDDRVHPGHARKFAATLAEYGFDYIYHENIEGGHSGASNLKELAFMKALDYAFFWKYLK